MTLERDELAAWLRLDMTAGVGSVTARKLLAAFGLPASIFAQNEASLRQVVSESVTGALRTVPPGLDAQVETTWNWMAQSNALRAHRVLVLGDANYPQSLLHMEDPPLILYSMGRANADLNAAAALTIAMVGSRNPTPQGVINARQFAQALAEAGLTVVSGLALGIDGAAHEGALAGATANQLATIAVVGTGLDRVYPRQHLPLAHRIGDAGVLLSEYRLGTAPHATNFPKRNRIISGLARATLVVEAALKSGSLITARLALEQGKDVFAIPGSIHATQARGCHALIKQGAKLIESAQDVLEEWGELPARIAPDLIAAPAMNTGAEDEFDTEDPLLHALGFDPVSLDALQARTGMPTPELQAALMALELAGTLQRLPGGLFQRMGQC
jgi:DNA processing protein